METVGFILKINNNISTFAGSENRKGLSFLSQVRTGWGQSERNQDVWCRLQWEAKWCHYKRHTKGRCWSDFISDTLHLSTRGQPKSKDADYDHSVPARNRLHTDDQPEPFEQELLYW